MLELKVIDATMYKTTEQELRRQVCRLRSIHLIHLYHINVTRVAKGKQEHVQDSNRDHQIIQALLDFSN